MIIKPYPTIIFDVGANIGIFSIHAATLFPNSKIYAFEPFLENFELLKKNTDSMKNIFCYNLAVSDFTGTSYLRNDLDKTAVKTTTLPEDESSQTCLTTTLENFCLEHCIKNIDFLKLDCEGAEYNILNTNLSFVKVIAGEYHVINRRNSEEIKNMLRSRNFIIKTWTNFLLNNGGIFEASKAHNND